jgi:nitrate reductase alpha subunit
MFRWRNIFGLSFIGLGSGGYYWYHNDNSFRSVCNLVYAGANMAYIYKFTQGTA